MSNIDGICYFGHPVNNRDVVSAELHALELDLIKASPSEFLINPIYRYANVKYANYITNISAAIQATMTQTDVIAEPTSYFVLNCDHGMPFTIPKVAVSLNRTDVALDSLLKTTYHATTISVNRKTVYVFDFIDRCLELLRNPSVNISPPVVQNMIPLSSYKSIIWLNCLIFGFLKTQRYSGNTSSVEFNYEEQNESESSEQPKKRQKNDESSKRIVILNRMKLKGISKSEFDAHICFGNTESVPELPGMFFPFVSALAKRDKTFVSEIVSRFFLRSLGSTIDMVDTRFQALRGDLGHIYATDYGDWINHIFKVIEICIITASRPFIIIENGKYMGMTIHNESIMFSFFRSQFYKGISAESLKRLVLSETTHTGSLTSIMNFANLIGPLPTNMLQLRSLLLPLDLRETQKIQIQRLAKYLAFPEPFRAQNTMQVIEVLYSLANPNTPIAENFGYHHSCLLNKDFEYLILSSFGSRAPLFSIPNGTKFKLNDKEVPERFTVRFVDLPTSFDSLQIIKTNAVYFNNSKQPSQSYCERVFTSTERDIALKHLQSICGITNVSSSTSTVVASTSVQTNAPVTWNNIW